MPHVSLVTAKYYREKLQIERIAERRHRNQRAIGALVGFGIALLIVDRVSCWANMLPQLIGDAFPW